MNAHNEQLLISSLQAAATGNTTTLKMMELCGAAAKALSSNPTNQPAAAQEAVAKVGSDHFRSIVDWLSPIPPPNTLLYAAPVTAAPADPEHGHIDPSWSLHDRVEFALRDAGFDLGEAAFVAEAASAAEESSPAAPGIDLEQFREAIQYAHDFGGEARRSERARLLALIDASPKGAAPAFQVPAGWSLVRTEPTAEMLDAGINEIDYDGNEVTDNVRNVWLAMIEAARKDSPKGGSEARDAARWRAVDAAGSGVTLRLHSARPGERAKVIDAAMQAQTDEAPTYTTGHCENHKKPGGCPLHNLQCGYPRCDRRQAGDAEVRP